MELREELLALVGRHLSPKMRYRTILLVSRSMHTVQSIASLLPALDEVWPQQPLRLDGADMFDDKGPVSATSLLHMIKQVEYERPIIVSGPLHMCDCWSRDNRQILWQHLAAFSSGPGIVVVDTPRGMDTDGRFDVAQKLSSVDAYCLKSRLSATEDRRG